MITARLNGELTVAQSYKNDGQDGHDPYYTANTVKQTVTVSATKEFPQGYVNLEGYALSAYHNAPYDMLLSFSVYQNPALEDWRLLEGEADINVELIGDPADWIQQAHRYLVERPSKSLIDCLSLFKQWDETDDAAIQGAINRAKEATGLAENDAKDLTGRDWGMMRESLNGIERVEIPESYS